MKTHTESEPDAPLPAHGEPATVEAAASDTCHVSFARGILCKLITVSIAAVLALAPMGRADGAQSSADGGSDGKAIVTVTARVKAFCSAEITRQPSEMIITGADIGRGYLDVDGGTVMRIRTNSKEGIILDIRNSNGTLKRILVSDGERNVEVSGAGGLVHIPSKSGTYGEVKEFSYRFYLSGEIQAGSYMWPISFSIDTI